MVIEPSGLIHFGDAPASDFHLTIQFDRNVANKNTLVAKEGEFSHNWTRPRLVFRVVLDGVPELKVEIPLSEFCTRLGIDYRNFLLAINPRNDDDDHEVSAKEYIPMPNRYAQKMREFLKHPWEGTWALAYKYTLHTFEKLGYHDGVDTLRIINNYFGPEELYHDATNHSIEDYPTCSCFKKSYIDGPDTSKQSDSDTGLNNEESSSPSTAEAASKSRGRNSKG